MVTNSWGFRGPELSETAADGEITILGIGASNMFGDGVGNEDLYTGHLEVLLNERYPARKWRVINTAVPSYNVVMKVETLKEKGLRFDPDFVLLHWPATTSICPTTSASSRTRSSSRTASCSAS